MSAHSTRSDVSGWGSPALSPVVRAGLRVLDAMTAGEFVKSFSDAGSQVLQVSRRRKVRAEKL